MKISIVIPTLNRKPNLQKVLDDIRNQDYPNYEVVILDGGSNDGTSALCEEYKKYIDIKFHIQKRPGFVAAMNEALQYCTGDVFTRTDDDVSLSKDWLSQIVQGFNAKPDAGGITGPTTIPAERRNKRDLIAFNEKIAQSKNMFWKLFKIVYHDYFLEKQPFAVSKFCKCGAFTIGSNYANLLNLKDIFEVDYLESCNWSVRLNLIRKIGGFDNHYGGVSEYFEADAVYRIKRQGYKMYFNPNASIFHLVDAGGNYRARGNAYSRARNFILFYFRNIKPNTLDKAVRFLSYLAFINVYFLYCFIKEKDLRQLSGIPGSIISLFKYSPEIFQNKIVI